MSCFYACKISCFYSCCSYFTGWDTKDEEFALFKINYYSTKLHLPREAVGALFREDFGKSYVLGLQWVLFYYMNGVPSWGWFYNSHYSPFVSDLRNLADYVPHFDLGVPFLPFQQLLSVMVLQELYLGVISHPYHSGVGVLLREGWYSLERDGWSTPGWVGVPGRYGLDTGIRVLHVYIYFLVSLPAPLLLYLSQPPACQVLVPSAYHALMTLPNSPIADLYPLKVFFRNHIIL